MADGEQFEIFLVAIPGLERTLCEEARSRGFASAKAIPGGVAFIGGWPGVWRANLVLRGATRVLARIGAFRVLHLAQLDKRARGVAWSGILRHDVPFRVEAACRKSRIYHSGAAAERIERAIREELGAPAADDAAVCIKARIDDDLCTIAVDTSGEPLHKRGFKAEINAAPMRETMASLFLRMCGYDGREPVVDPMCGSGTFVIEAAEIAAKLEPGRGRSFAFEQLATFDGAQWSKMRKAGEPSVPKHKCYGSDRDPGAIRISQSNAARAGVSNHVVFSDQPVEELFAPDDAKGLVITNPPYGARIGDAKHLVPLYRAFGQTMMTRFKGWRVGLITSDPSLAKATALPFNKQSPPIVHGGIRVVLYQTAPLS